MKLKSRKNELWKRGDMEEDRIGLVLVRVSELRSKVTCCIQKAFVIGDNEEVGRKLKGSEAGAGEDAEYVDADDEADSLLNIRDALESLESQLAALQVIRFFHVLSVFGFSCLSFS